MEKVMYALTYCYEGTDNAAPYGVTIAISNDIKKLRVKMKECVEEDCVENEDDEWADDKNFTIHREYIDEITLQHTKDRSLFATYRIHQVDVL